MAKQSKSSSNALIDIDIGISKQDRAAIAEGDRDRLGGGDRHGDAAGRARRRLRLWRHHERGRQRTAWRHAPNRRQDVSRRRAVRQRDGN